MSISPNCSKFLSKFSSKGLRNMVKIRDSSNSSTSGINFCVKLFVCNKNLSTMTGKWKDLLWLSLVLPLERKWLRTALVSPEVDSKGELQGSGSLSFHLALYSKSCSRYQGASCLLSIFAQTYKWALGYFSVESAWQFRLTRTINKITTSIYF